MDELFLRATADAKLGAGEPLDLASIDEFRAQ
jgi:hypothetical protein